MIEGIKISFSNQEIHEILSNISQVLKSGYLVKDKFFDQFKQLILDYSGREYCALASSDTMAQEMLFKALDLGGKTVIFQGNMFPSPVFAAIRAGCKPKYADIDMECLSLTKATVKQVMDGSVGAVVVMHSGGLINWKIHSLAAACKDWGVLLIEDCAHAYGSRYYDLVAGGVGDYAVYSFYATKPATTGEGGAVVGDNPEVIERIETFTRYGKTEWFGPPYCEEMGYSARMTELLSAVGAVTLKTIDEKIKARERVALRYFEEVGNLKIKHFAWGTPNWYKYPVLLKGITREEAVQKFAEAEIKISAGIYDFPVYRQKPILDETVNLPNSELFCRQHICLPMHEMLTDEDSTRVIEVANAL